MKKTYCNSRKLAAAASLALALVTLAVGPGCKKDGKSGVSAKLSLLTSSSWTLQKWELGNGDGTWSHEETNSSSPNYEVSFNKDNTLTVVGNSVIGRWEGDSDYAHITVTGTQLDGSYSVTALTSSSLVLEATNHTTRWTYGK